MAEYSHIRNNNITMISSVDMRTAKVGDLIKTVAVNGKLQAALSTAVGERVVGVLAQAVDPNVNTTGQAITISMFAGGGVVKVNATGSLSATDVTFAVCASGVAGKAILAGSENSKNVIGIVASVDIPNSTYNVNIMLRGRNL
jgi:hypothetical protein